MVISLRCYDVCHFLRYTYSMKRKEARNFNRFSIRNIAHPIIPVRNANGALPPGWFPADTRALEQATGVNQLNPLLTFYGLPANGTLNQRRDRLRIYLGIPI